METEAVRTTLSVASWNVNGLRACTKKGFVDWLQSSGHDIVGLQEVRAFVQQLDDTVAKPAGWHAHFTAAKRPGYSGVGLYTRLPPDDLGNGLGEERFDSEGRFQWVRIGELVVANVYFPKGSGTKRDNSRVPYKLDFYRAAKEVCETFVRDGRKVLVMGDFNTAHEARDLARPKQNVQTSGFLQEERDEFSRWITDGWFDTFRVFEGGEGHYSWWSQRFGLRERNVGWRIDYVLASPNARKFATSAAIHPDVRGSDHCPVSAQFDRTVID